MKNLLKSFGKGLLYLIAFPGILVVLALLAVVGLVIFIILGIKGAILFFQGKSLFNDLPEDVEGRRLKNLSTSPAEESKPESSGTDVVFTTASNYNFEPMNTLNEAPNDPAPQEEVKEEDNNEY